MVAVAPPYLLKAALAGEIMGANEVGVKRAEARPSLRSQFRHRLKDCSSLDGYVAEQPRLRPGHGGRTARGRALAVRTSSLSDLTPGLGLR